MDVDSWAVKLICALFGSKCIDQGKRCREWKQKVMQVERDKADRDILDKLGANKSGEHKDVR